MKKTVNYFAFAKNSNGQLGQLFVIRKNGMPFSQQWTGKTYPTTKDAEEDMSKLNCPAGRF